MLFFSWELTKSQIVKSYHCNQSSPEDLNFMDPCKENVGNTKSHSEESGGVINFSIPNRVEYANRIRHCGLGGFEYYDNMFMTVNERFIVVNTRTGNLMLESDSASRPSPSCEGLFVVDLDDCEHCKMF